MTEKKGRGPRRSDRPGAIVAADLKQKRDAFLHSFFRRGAELTDELVHENKRLRDEITTLEEENAALKTQLASDRAIRDLLEKIDGLEREKSRLLSTVHEHEEITNRFTNRFAEIEQELESFANLYVASFQLHISLRARAVARNVKELLVQLIGVRSLAIYFLDEQQKRLAPISSEGVDMATLPVVSLGDGATADPAAAIIERTVLTGIAHVTDGEIDSRPAACVPMQLDDRVVGAIVVYSLLEQKRRFVTVDRELFKLLGAHLGATLVAAHSWSAGDGRLPTPEALRALCA
jgi:GAF domain